VRTAIVLFTRDLRVHDQPALAAAAREADEIVPLFVLEERLLRRSPNRAGFLLECLHELDTSLRRLGGRLVVRRGDTVAEVARVAQAVRAEAVFLSEDVTGFARRREQGLRRALGRAELRVAAGVPVVPAGQLRPAGRDHYRVFTPYWNAWRSVPWRSAEPSPTRLAVPASAVGEPLPRPPVRRTPVAHGGEREGRRLVERWLGRGCADYPELRNDLAADATSRLSPYLRFGCVSALELAIRAGDGEYRRQLCWRDFYHQVLAASPWAETRDLVPLRYDWDHDPEALEAWQAGMTGYPIVDAGMRQLAAEGWMHNRARMIVASFLTKDLNLDWRLGAAHFDRLLLDGDPGSNVGGWQWVAGTGVDTRPGRMFNPTLQARRFDPLGAYVRRWVHELAHVPGPTVHEPWLLEMPHAAPDYPAPIVDHAVAAARYRARFGYPGSA
jgi:deoxyribodipyrimidine photo-lyase